MGEEIKVGDIVELKSGGPRMTVGAIINEDHVRCYWFHLQRGGEWGMNYENPFPMDILRRVG